MASTLDFLKRLTDHNVEFVVVGGMAGILHGSSLVTQDLDLCAPMTPENINHILQALREIHPRFRMHPDRPPLPEDPARLAGFKNLYISTDLGEIDFLAEITGVGDFDTVSQSAIKVRVSGVECRVIDIDSLILAKRAMGRAKDQQAAIELESIRDRDRPAD